MSPLPPSLAPDACFWGDRLSNYFAQGKHSAGKEIVQNPSESTMRISYCFTKSYYYRVPLCHPTFGSLFDWLWSWLCWSHEPGRAGRNAEHSQSPLGAFWSTLITGTWYVHLCVWVQTWSKMFTGPCLLLTGPGHPLLWCLGTSLCSSGEWTEMEILLLLQL
jgi:hypothetical protein